MDLWTALAAGLLDYRREPVHKHKAILTRTSFIIVLTPVEYNR